MPYLEQVPDVVDKYYQPIIDLGTSQGNAAAGTYSQMAQNPAAFIDNLMGSYNQSNYSKYQEDEMTDAASAAAAQGGYSGTQQDVKNQEEITQGLLSKDEQQYLNNLMRSINTGLGGEQQMYNLGVGASGQAANANIGNLNTEAGLAYKGQQNENAYNSAQTNAFLNMLGYGVGAGLNYLMPSSSGSNYSMSNSAPTSKLSPSDLALMSAFLV